MSLLLSPSTPRSASPIIHPTPPTHTAPVTISTHRPSSIPPHPPPNSHSPSALLVPSLNATSYIPLSPHTPEAILAPLPPTLHLPILVRLHLHSSLFCAPLPRHVLLHVPILLRQVHSFLSPHAFRLSPRLLLALVRPHRGLERRTRLADSAICLRNGRQLWGSYLLFSLPSAIALRFSLRSRTRFSPTISGTRSTRCWSPPRRRWMRDLALLRFRAIPIRFLGFEARGLGSPRAPVFLRRCWRLGRIRWRKPLSRHPTFVALFWWRRTPHPGSAPLAGFFKPPTGHPLLFLRAFLLRGVWGWRGLRLFEPRACFPLLLFRPFFCHGGGCGGVSRRLFEPRTSFPLLLFRPFFCHGGCGR